MDLELAPTTPKTQYPNYLRMWKQRLARKLASCHSRTTHGLREVQLPRKLQRYLGVEKVTILPVETATAKPADKSDSLQRWHRRMAEKVFGSDTQDRADKPARVRLQLPRPLQRYTGTQVVWIAKDGTLFKDEHGDGIIRQLPAAA